LSGGDEFAVDMVLLAQRLPRVRQWAVLGMPISANSLRLYWSRTAGIQQPLSCRRHDFFIGIGTQTVDSDTGLYRFFTGGGFNFEDFVQIYHGSAHRQFSGLHYAAFKANTQFK
jgi:hypothetical protein